MRHALFATTALLAAASGSFGAAWIPPAGVTSNFTYANGNDFNGIFGTPSVSNTGFSFAPTTLIATASNNSIPSSSSDTAVVDLTAAPGKSFASVTAQVAGDFTIFGTGTADAVGALAVLNLDTNAVLALAMTFTGVPAATTTSTGGLFTGTVTIAVPAGWNHIQIAVPNTDHASAALGASSLIQTKSVSINLAFVPEPTIGLAGIAGIGALARRRK